MQIYKGVLLNFANLFVFFLSLYFLFCVSNNWRKRCHYHIFEKIFDNFGIGHIKTSLVRTFLLLKNQKLWLKLLYLRAETINFFGNRELKKELFNEKIFVIKIMLQIRSTSLTRQQQILWRKNFFEYFAKYIITIVSLHKTSFD